MKYNETVETQWYVQQAERYAKCIFVYREKSPWAQHIPDYRYSVEGY